MDNSPFKPCGEEEADRPPTCWDLCWAWAELASIIAAIACGGLAGWFLFKDIW